MNKLLFDNIFKIVKSDFCGLFDFKLRGDTLEIITSIPTLTNSYVSVFFTYRNGEYIVSDGGWIFQKMYDNEVLDSNTDILEKLIPQYKEHYNIKETESKDKHTYYYKKTNNEKLVSAIVFEVANFVAQIVNAQSLMYNDVKDETERQMFHTSVNSFLRENYKEVKIKSPLSGYSVKVNFSAIVTMPSTVNLVMYITGANTSYFNNDISKASMHFDMIMPYINPDYFNLIPIINETAQGFDKEKNAPYIEHLAKKTNIAPILFYSGKTNVFNHIPVLSLN